MSGFISLGPVISAVAAVDLSGSQGRFVRLDSNGKFDLPVAGGPAAGVLVDNAGTAGQACSAQIAGIAEVVLGGTVAPEDYVKVDSAGRAVTASGAEVAAGKAVGQCQVGGSSGATGAILLATLGAGQVALTESESIATTVATSALTRQTLITLVTANHTGALADGKYVGQRKDLRVIADSGGFTYVLTPTTMQANQPASFTFTSTGQYVQLTWAADGWYVTDIRTAGTAATAAAGTINPLVARQGLTIGSAGAEARTLPNGYVPGHTIVIAADTVGSGTTTIAGLFVNAAGTAGTNTTYNAALDSARYTWNGAKWMLGDVISVTSA